MLGLKTYCALLALGLILLERGPGVVECGKKKAADVGRGNGNGNGGNGNANGRGRKGSKGGRPSPGCDFADPPKSLPANVKDLLKDIAAGTKTIKDIIPVLKEVPSYCIASLAEKSAEWTDMTEADLETGLCNIGDNILKASAFAPAVKISGLTDTQICISFATVLADINCADSHEMIKAYRDRTACPIVTLVKEDFFKVDRGKVKAYLNAMQQQSDKETLLNDVAEMVVAFGDDEFNEINCNDMMDFVELLLQNSGTASGELVGDPYLEAKAKFIPFFPHDYCDPITAAKVVEKKDLIQTLDFGCARGRRKGNKKKGKGGLNNSPCLMTCGATIYAKLKTLAADGSTSVPDVEKIESLTNLRKCEHFKAMKESAAPGLCGNIDAEYLDSASNYHTPWSLKETADKCKPDKAANSFTVDDLISMGCTILFYKDLSSIPTTVLCEANYFTDHLVPCLQNLPRGVPRRRMKSIVELCPNEADVIKGTGIAFLQSPAVLRSMGSSLTMDKANQLAKGLEMVPKEARGRVVFDVVATAATETLVGLKDFMKFVSRKKLTTDVDDVTSLLSSDLSGLNMYQKVVLTDMYFTKEGIENVTELTPAAFMDLKSLAEGFTASQIQNFDIMIRREIYPSLCKYTGFQGKQVEALAAEVNAMIQSLNPVNPLETFTADEISEMQGGCFALISAENLTSATRPIRYRVCQSIGQFPQLKCVINKDMRANLATVCADKDDVNSGDTTTDPVEIAGTLVQDLDETTIQAMTPATIRKLLRNFLPVRCLRKAVRDIIETKLVQEFETTDMMDTDKVDELGEFAYVIHTAKHETAANILASYAKRDMVDEQMQECCMGEMSPEDKIAALAHMAAVENARNAISIQVATAAAAANRKKRQTTPTVYTCADLELVDISQLSVAEIDAMTGPEFTKCLDVFGSGSSFATDVPEAILARVKTLIADPADICKLTAVELGSLGALAQYLTAANIECLEFFEGVSLGGYSGYSKIQLEKFAAKFLEANSIADGSALTLYDINSMGHFVCGLSAENIQKVPLAVFEKSAAVIGQLEMCPQAALDEWAKRSVESFKAVKDWDQSHVAEAGILVGGLTAEQLMALSVEAFSGFTKQGLSNIPADRLTQVEPAKLAGLARYQTYYLTDAQKEGLTEEHRDVLGTTAAGFTSPDEVETGTEGEDTGTKGENIGPGETETGTGGTETEETETEGSGDGTKEEGGGSGHVTFSALTIIAAFLLALCIQ